MPRVGLLLFSSTYRRDFRSIPRSGPKFIRFEDLNAGQQRTFFSLLSGLGMAANAECAG